MTTEIIFRYFHFIGIFTLFAALVSEHLLLDKTMTRSAIKRVSVVDAVFGISAVIVLTTGLLLWFVYGKSAEFYSKNAIFHTKVMLFVIVGLLSIHPTIYFLKTRKGDLSESVTLPKSVIMMVRMELLLVTIIPLLAALMAKGVGSFAS